MTLILARHRHAPVTAIYRGGEGSPQERQSQHPQHLYITQQVNDAPWRLLEPSQRSVHCLKKSSVSNPQIFVTNKMGPDDRNDIITIWGNIPKEKKSVCSKIMIKILDE